MKQGSNQTTILRNYRRLTLTGQIFRWSNRIEKNTCLVTISSNFILFDKSFTFHYDRSATKLSVDEHIYWSFDDTSNRCSKIFWSNQRIWLLLSHSQRAFWKSKNFVRCFHHCQSENSIWITERNLFSRWNSFSIDDIRFPLNISRSTTATRRNSFLIDKTSNFSLVSKSNEFVFVVEDSPFHRQVIID